MGSPGAHFGSKLGSTKGLNQIPEDVSSQFYFIPSALLFVLRFARLVP